MSRLRRAPALAGLAVALAVWTAARAAADTPSESASPTYAIGVALAAEPRRVYGSGDVVAFVPELIGQTYLSLGIEPLWLRLGARVGIEGIVQPDFPSRLRVDERGFYTAIEGGISIDWIVVPSLSVGAGLIYRWVDFQSVGNVSGADALDQFELLSVFYAEIELGIPIERGRVVLEPFVRFSYVPSDERAWFRGGAAATLSFD